MRGYIKKLLKETAGIDSLEPKPTLNPKIWAPDGEIDDEIINKLIDIADDFYNSLDISYEYDDLLLTGILANYNWSDYSDFDLHILLDTEKLDDNKGFIEDLLKSKTDNWNDKHDIKLRGYDVELYIQPKDQKHDSTGVYSLKNKEWVNKPKPSKEKIDKNTILKKYKKLTKKIDKIINKFNEGELKYVEAEKVISQIKKMRQASLDKDGEYGSENLIFKLLRRNGYIEKLFSIKNKGYDKEMTIEGNS